MVLTLMVRRLKNDYFSDFLNKINRSKKLFILTNDQLLKNLRPNCLKFSACISKN